MDELLFGEGWLDDLLREPSVHVALKDEVRKRLRKTATGGEWTWEEDWREIDGLLAQGEVGPALRKGMASLCKAAESLGEMAEKEKRALERPFSPFLVRSREIKRVLHPREDVERLADSRDDLDAVISLELLNDARRLLASWGVHSWGEEPLRLIPRLEKDLEELRHIQSSLRDREDSGFEDLEAEMETADRFATAATRFAHDLFELHLLNARNPEVPFRFRLLWGTVWRLEDEGDIASAGFEALQVLQEVFQLAGLGGGETLEMVDMLYERFSDPEGLRRAVDRLTMAQREGEEDLGEEELGEYIQAVCSALGDMGLDMKNDS